PAARLVRGCARARRPLPAPHPRGLQGRGPAAGLGLSRPRRERLPHERALTRPGQRHVAVHLRDRAALRPEPGLVGGRPRGSREGHASAGERKVQLEMDRYNVTDFWSLARTRALRAETKNYVPLIHAAIVVAKAPAKYGFDVDPETLPASETLAVNGAVDLRFLSECSGATLDQIQLLNPSLRRLATPAGRTFQLRVPQGTAQATSRCLASTPPEKRVQFRTHTVSRGQTLATIAAGYGIKTADLASANSMVLKRRPSVGTELIIPIDPRAGVARAARPAPAAAPTRAADLPATAAKRPRISYRVKPGDTLAG